MAQKEKTKAGVVEVPFGKTKDGEAVKLFVLTNSKGTVAKVMSYGATLTELWVADKEKNLADVCLGFDNLKGYEQEGSPFFGCVCGRYANRIAKGKFTLDGKEYKLFINNKPNTLHGGKKGFDKYVWKIVETKEPLAVAFSHKSADGDEGYPGNLTTTVTYQLTEDNELRILYSATTDKATVLNLTNHTYFNLAGHNAGTVLDHEVTILAAKYTPVDDTLIPTGKIEAVKGTPFDFLKPATLGSRIDKLKGEPGGYDINYVLDSGGGKLALGVTVREPKSGRILQMSTTEPGVQLYTGNYLNGKAKGKGGTAYKKQSGFCLEAQHFPDSPNQKDFPSTVLKPGQTYKQETVYKFTAK